MRPGLWLPSHRAPIVLCPASCFGFGFVFLAFAGVSLLGLLGVRFTLGVVVHKGFAARNGGPFWKPSLRELSVIHVLRETGILGLLHDCDCAEVACSCCRSF